MDSDNINSRKVGDSKGRKLLIEKEYLSKINEGASHLDPTVDAYPACSTSSSCTSGNCDVPTFSDAGTSSCLPICKGYTDI